MSEYEYEPAVDAADEAEPDESWDESAADEAPMEVPGAETAYDAAVLGPQKECELCGGMYGLHADRCPYAGL